LARANPACDRSTNKSRSNYAAEAIADIVIFPAALVRPQHQAHRFGSAVNDPILKSHLALHRHVRLELTSQKL
jgi:hypothetical protein